MLTCGVALCVQSSFGASRVTPISSSGAAPMRPQALGDHPTTADAQRSRPIDARARSLRAHRSGLTARGVHDFGFDKIFRTAANPVAAYGEFFDNVLRNLSGAPPPSAASVAFFGHVPAHIYVGVADELRGRGWRVASGGEDLIPAERIESISGASFRLRASTSTRGRRSRCSPRIAIWSRPATSSRSSRASTTRSRDRRPDRGHVRRDGPRCGVAMPEQPGAHAMIEKSRLPAAFQS